jgi:hypothetical protein
MVHRLLKEFKWKVSPFYSPLKALLAYTETSLFNKGVTSMKSSRRTFLKTAGAAITFPTIIPSHVLGADAPSKTIALGQIGCGRIARDMDMSGLLKCKGAHYVRIATSLVRI